MAKKTTTKNSFDIKQLLDSSGSYKNLIYGAVTVLVLAIIIFLGIRTLSENQGDINDGAVTVEEENTSDYAVVEGDTLWSISEKVYGTGFNWQMIADANNIVDPNNLEAGTKLNIPDATPTASQDEDQAVQQVSPTQAPAEQAESERPASTATEYTVVAGDNLWKIAEAQYNDGYKWVEIAKANELVNPNIIHAGNRLVIPR